MRTARRQLTAEKSSVHLNTQVGEKNQFYIDITKEENRNTDMTDHLKSLRAEQTLIESEDQNLQERGNEMTKLCQEKEMESLEECSFQKDY